MRNYSPLWLFAVILSFVSCDKVEEPVPVEEDTPAPEVKAPEPVVTKPTYWSEVKLHEVIREANPGYSGNGQFQIDEQGQVRAIALDNCGVSDITPLKGMPLMALYLLGCEVPDISPLQGMSLVELYLENTAVKDISALEGMTELRKLYLSNTEVDDLSPITGLGIVEMNLVHTPVTDLSALKGMPLQMLWLTDAPVVDISPLSSSPLVSLTLHRTKVNDLSPLANTALQRLHIGETEVTDLNPLKGLRLTRLVFDPDDIQKGMEAVKAIPTITEIGTKFEDGENDLKPAAAFWQERG
ncbi:MAG: leucine-rich repeat domain-containing protein [Verrucomicrobiales bacterium]|nr:leucine-rich repeat domain-containing protein [Verrucomicrobiales bacterium]